MPGRGMLARAGALVCALFAILFAGIASAQVPLPELTTAAAPAPPPELPGLKHLGGFDVAPIEFQANRLFAVTAPARASSEGPAPIEVRVLAIEESFNRVIATQGQGTFWFVPPATILDPDTFAVVSARENGFIVLKAQDAHHPDEIPLLTVTDLDAKYYGVPPSELAEQWRQQLQRVLGDALAKRQPDRLRQQLLIVPAIALVVGLISWALSAVRRRASHRAKGLQEERADLDPASARYAEIDRSLFRARFIGWLAWWMTACAWGMASLYVLSLFPNTDVLSRQLARALAKIALTWLAAAVLNRVGTTAIAHAAETWNVRPRVKAATDERWRLRMPTVIASLDGLKTVTVYLVAAAFTLEFVGVPIGSVLTFGAIIAFAISFSAQSLIKDIVAGFLTLVEDHYAKDDFVSVTLPGGGHAEGIVEGFSLRATQLRDESGRLISIGNGSIVVAANYTKEWSRVDFRVTVASDADLVSALDVLGKALAEMRADPAWSDVVTEAPNVLGVEALSSDGVVLRAWITTRPGRRGPVLREANLRVHDAFAAAGIPSPVPQLDIRGGTGRPNDDRR